MSVFNEPLTLMIHRGLKAGSISQGIIQVVSSGATRKQQGGKTREMGLDLSVIMNLILIINQSNQSK